MLDGCNQGIALIENWPTESVSAIAIFPQLRPKAAYDRGPMTIPVATRRKRGNPNWGRPIPPTRAFATEFELRVRQLELTPQMYTSSRELRAWCERNRNRVYIPEWLLKEWRIIVDAFFSGVA